MRALPTEWVTVIQSLVSWALQCQWQCPRWQVVGVSGGSCHSSYQKTVLYYYGSISTRGFRRCCRIPTCVEEKTRTKGGSGRFDLKSSHERANSVVYDCHQLHLNPHYVVRLPALPRRGRHAPTLQVAELAAAPPKPESAATGFFPYAFSYSGNPKANSVVPHDGHVGANVNGAGSGTAPPRDAQARACCAVQRRDYGGARDLHFSRFTNSPRLPCLCCSVQPPRFFGPSPCSTHHLSHSSPGILLATHSLASLWLLLHAICSRSSPHHSPSFSL